MLQDSDSSSVTIGPHWPSSYPEFLSPHQNKSEQQRIVWARLQGQRSNLAKSLKEQRERYEALRRELNPRTTQAESSHDPLYRDTPHVHPSFLSVCLCHPNSPPPRFLNADDVVFCVHFQHNMLGMVAESHVGQCDGEVMHRATVWWVHVKQSETLLWQLYAWPVTG